MKLRNLTVAERMFIFKDGKVFCQRLKPLPDGTTIKEHNLENVP